MTNQSVIDRKPSGFMFAAITSIYVTAYAFASIFMMKVLGNPIAGVPFAIAADLCFFIILYVGSDIFSQVYGYKVSRQTAKLAAGITLVLGLVGKLLTLVPAAPGNEFMDGIFGVIYGGNFYITFISVAVFFVGDYINDVIFQKLRIKHNNSMSFKNFTFRSVLSSFAGRMFDLVAFTVLCNLVINAPDLGLGQPFIGVHNLLGLESWQQSWEVIIASMICTAVAQPLLEFIFAPLSRKLCMLMIEKTEE